MTPGARSALMAELRLSGVKHSADDIVAIGRNAAGRVVFLEKGTLSAGLRHIVSRHGDDFARAGIKAEDIPDVVTGAVARGKVVGMQGTRPVYEVVHNGTVHRIAVSVGDNGFVVGANPAGRVKPT